LLEKTSGFHRNLLQPSDAHYPCSSPPGSGLRQAASTLTERRQALPWVIFEEILRSGLHALAD
jgi:hypothetical protein